MAIYKCIACGGKYGPLLADPFKMERGFKTNDGNYAHSQECARSWNAALLISGNNSNQSNSGTSGGGGFGGGGDNVSKPQASKTAEQILAEAEAEKVKHQIDMEKQAAIDKSDKEFFESVKKNWKAIVAVVIVLAIAIGIFSYINGNSKQNDAKLSQQLEQIEDKVKLAIQSGEKEKALDLANQLIHPSHENMESQKFDAWNGYPKYDEFWSKKREVYKEQIMQINGPSKIESIQEKPQVQETKTEQTTLQADTTLSTD